MSTKDSGELATAVAREIEALSRISPTRPGPSNAPDTHSRHDPALVEAINQVFALFRLNYHNQFYAAFSEAEQVRQIKKLWLDSLRDYPPVLILQGARKAIESSDYLPTLNRMRRCCDDSLSALGLPDVGDAYLEAANCAPPPETHRWSHPVIYWSGRDCGWQFLATTKETRGLPAFTARYRARCAALLRGDSLPDIPSPSQPALQSQALDQDAALEQLRAIREEHGL